MAELLDRGGIDVEADSTNRVIWGGPMGQVKASVITAAHHEFLVDGLQQIAQLEHLHGATR